MEKNISRSEKKVNISEMPPGKSFDDYTDDTIFVLDDSDDDNWEEEENIDSLPPVNMAGGIFVLVFRR